jgi:hypothetical protein
MKLEAKKWTVGELLEALEGKERSEEVTFSRPNSKPQVECWCGCGGMTRSRFCPGHDARFHGLAKKVARGQEDYDEQVQALPHEDAVAEFERHVNRERPIHEAKEEGKRLEAEAKQKLAEAEAEAEKAETVDA